MIEESSKEVSNVYLVQYIFWGLLPFYWRNLNIGEKISKQCPESEGESSSNSFTSVKVEAKHEVVFTNSESTYPPSDHKVTLKKGSVVTLPVKTILSILSYKEKIIV